MKAGGIDWQFHVATMVRAQESGWWVIDNVPGDVVSVEQWMRHFQAQNSDNSLMFFVSEPHRLNSHGNPRFNADHLKFAARAGTDPLYAQYFNDMMTSFRHLSWVKMQTRMCKNVFVSVSAMGPRPVKPQVPKESCLRRLVSRLVPMG